MKDTIVKDYLDESETGLRDNIVHLNNAIDAHLVNMKRIKSNNPNRILYITVKKKAAELALRRQLCIALLYQYTDDIDETE